MWNTFHLPKINFITDILIEINNYSMKPLEEYMVFTKNAIENITVINAQGIRSDKCSMQFDTSKKFIAEPTLNFTMVGILSFF